MKGFLFWIVVPAIGLIPTAGVCLVRSAWDWDVFMLGATVGCLWAAIALFLENIG